MESRSITDNVEPIQRLWMSTGILYFSGADWIIHPDPYYITNTARPYAKRSCPRILVAAGKDRG